MIKTTDIKLIIKGSLKEMKLILPIFFLAVLAGVLIEMYVPEQLVNTILGKNLFIAIPLAAALGVILPIPRYATYPIAFALLMKGAGYGVVFALISGEVIFESLVRDYIEVKYFGIKFFSLRMIISLVLIIAASFIIEAIL